MRNYIEAKKQKLKKKLITMGLSILAPIIIFVIPFATLMMLIGGGGEIVPSAADELVDEYQELCNTLKLDWEEIMIYDMVRTDNDFTFSNPSEACLRFFQLGWEEYTDERREVDIYDTNADGTLQLDEDGNPIPSGGTTFITERVMTGSGVVGSDGFYNYLNRHFGFITEGDIETILACLDKLQKDPDIVITYHSLALRDFYSEFDDKQLELIDILISESILVRTYGDYYDLPDYIETQVALGNFFAWPTPGNVTISSSYGWRKHPIRKTRKFHGGMDIVGLSPGACEGDPVISIADGVVLKVSHGGTGWGKTVLVEHTDSEDAKWTSRYAHLAQISVSENEIIEVGTVIGAIGSTGDSTGPHLHLEIKREALLYNPALFYNINGGRYTTGNGW